VMGEQRIEAHPNWSKRKGWPQCNMELCWRANASPQSPDLGRKIGCPPRHWIPIRRPKTATTIFAFTPSNFLKSTRSPGALRVYYFGRDHPNICVKYATVKILACTRDYYNKNPHPRVPETITTKILTPAYEKITPFTTKSSQYFKK
jgi:hypothetical protein